MAHMIDESTGVPAIAYVGDKPWHGLGQQLDKDATIETWTVAAGLNWGVERTQVEFTIGDSDTPIFMPNRHVLYRQDTLKPLSVVSDTYKVVQPAQIMEFFRELTTRSDAQMETAGSLSDGKTIWALARLGNNEMVLDDEVAPFLLLSTSYDMSTPTLAKFVATRVVCNNTIQIAMGESGKKQVRIPHSTEFRAEDVRAGLDISLNEFEAFKQKATSLASRPFMQSDMDRYLIQLLQPDNGEIDGDQIRKSKAYKNIMDLFQGSQLGAQQTASKNTAWGAVNAVTQFIDHQKGRNQSARLQDAWWGMGAKFKERAFDLLAA